LSHHIKRHLSLGASLYSIVCAPTIYTISVCALQQDEGLIARRPFRYTHVFAVTHTRSAPAQLLYTSAVRLQSKYASAAGAFSECVRAFTLCCICAAVHSPLWCTRERDDLIGLILRRTTGPMCGILHRLITPSVNKTNYYYGNLIRSVFSLGNEVYELRMGEKYSRTLCLSSVRTPLVTFNLVVPLLILRPTDSMVYYLMM
jgi:hypothetical protein